MLKNLLSVLAFGIVFVLVGCQSSYLDDKRDDNIEYEQTGIK